MKPGITGLWQTSGRSNVGFADWMRMDQEYVDRWSLGLDLRLLLATIPAVLSRRGRGRKRWALAQSVYTCKMSGALHKEHQSTP